jgi:hypothetical protein
VPSREPSDRPAPDAGVPALWLALAGCLGAGLLVFGVYDDRIPLGLAIPLFFGIPLSEFAALVCGSRSRRLGLCPLEVCHDAVAAFLTPLLSGVTDLHEFLDTSSLPC